MGKGATTDFPRYIVFKITPPGNVMGQVNYLPNVYQNVCVYNMLYIGDIYATFMKTLFTKFDSYELDLMSSNEPSRAFVSFVR